MVIELRQYTKAFKREAVRLMETSGKLIAAIARSGDQRQQPVSVAGSVSEMEAESKRLRPLA
jgi:hypothetical protein